jgi:hypothetical protein
LNIDIDHIGEQPMTNYLPQSAAAVIAWAIVNALWLTTLAPAVA